MVVGAAESTLALGSLLAKRRRLGWKLAFAFMGLGGVNLTGSSLDFFGSLSTPRRTPPSSSDWSLSVDLGVVC